MATTNWILNGKSTLATARAIIPNRILSECLYETAASSSIWKGYTRACSVWYSRIGKADGASSGRIFPRWNRNCTRDQLLIFLKRQIKLFPLSRKRISSVCRSAFGELRYYNRDRRWCISALTFAFFCPTIMQKRKKKKEEEKRELTNGGNNARFRRIETRNEIQSRNVLIISEHKINKGNPVLYLYKFFSFSPSLLSYRLILP